MNFHSFLLLSYCSFFLFEDFLLLFPAYKSYHPLTETSLSLIELAVVV